MQWGDSRWVRVALAAMALGCAKAPSSLRHHETSSSDVGAGGGDAELADVVDGADAAVPGPDAAISPSDSGVDDVDAEQPGVEDVVAPEGVPGDDDTPGESDDAVAPVMSEALVVACPGVTVTATLHGDRTVRVRLGEVPPSFAVLDPPPVQSGVLGTLGTSQSLSGDGLVVAIDTVDCRVTVTTDDGRELVKDLAPPEPGRVQRAAPNGRRYFGFGEKTGPLDKRGMALTFWNTDAYDSTYGGYGPGADPLYLSVPVYVALQDGAAHGVFTDTTWRLTMDVAKTMTDRLEIRADGQGVIDQWIVDGPEVPDVVRRLTALTGRPPRFPRWALGYHQSRWGYWPDDAVIAVADGFAANDMPASALWLDIQHMDGFRTFTFDPVGFPDPEGLTADLLAKGLRTVAIADPGIKVDPGWSVYDDGTAEGLWLSGADGSPFAGTVWPGDAVFPDFTLPAARAFWSDAVAGLVERGVAGIWLDVNEPTVFPESGGGSSVPNELMTGIGLPMAAVHNVYAVLQARATVEGMLAAEPDRRPFVLSRAGYAGIQRHAAVWTGDAPSRFDTLAEQLPMLLNMGLSGVPMVGSDVGGYSGNASPELFARWMSLGLISPFFRGHVTSGVPGQEPWAFGTEVKDISRLVLERRVELIPYLEDLLIQATETGAPPLRPLLYHYQDDPVIAANQTQAMLGPWLMAAPVLAAGAESVTVTFPPGRWMERYSGAVIEGPATREVPVTLQALPMYLREGAIVPLADRIDVFPGPTPSTWTHVEDAGDGNGPERRTTITASKTGTGVSLDVAVTGTFVAPVRPYRIRPLDAAPTMVAVNDAPHAAWSFDANARALTLSLPPGNAKVAITVDTALVALAPPVLVTFEVTVPEGTPPNASLTFAGSPTGWEHVPLTGPIAVPRGEWFFYKYGRGDWCTVEKWPGCAEATDRYAFGMAHTKTDTVYGWRDWCDACP